jgi:hypothetical protein
MSYRNFKPTVWEVAIEEELKRNHIFVADTNQKYEGKVSKAGDSVRILGVGKPTITTTIGDEDIILEKPENIEDTSVTLKIDHRSTFNFLVDDIDKAQASGEIESALKGESSEGLANEQDIAVSALSNDPLVKKLASSAFTLSTDNILTVFDKALEALYENDVAQNTEIVFCISPWIYTIFKQAYIKADTNNSEMLKNGMVAKYGNATIKMSNNCAKDSKGNTLVQVKTKRAIGFAAPLTHVEPYRPDERFADALKGFVLYGTKIVRPKEMIVIPCTHA